MSEEIPKLADQIEQRMAGAAPAVQVIGVTELCRRIGFQTDLHLLDEEDYLTPAARKAAVEAHFTAVIDATQATMHSAAGRPAFPEENLPSGSAAPQRGGERGR
jgi:hypothetical protein